MSDISTESPSLTLVDSVVMGDGTKFELLREGEEWMVRVAGRMLMSSQVTDSEEALATEALDRVPDAEDILVGGLGLGFTLRAVLDEASEDAVVTVAELVPRLVAWNHEYVGALAEHPLDDFRTEVVVGNVLDVIQGSSGRFDAIVLDVDNGPVALSNDENGRLYSAKGVRACHAALRSYGLLAVWSAGPSPEFERRLRSAHFEVEVVRTRAREGALARHVLFLARRLPLSSRGSKRL